jgi:hypothetical protein
MSPEVLERLVVYVQTDHQAHRTQQYGGSHDNNELFHGPDRTIDFRH